MSSVELNLSADLPGTMSSGGSLRILALSNTWQGATDYGLVRALRRHGHSVSVISEAEFYPAKWNHPLLKILRRALTPLIVAEIQRALIREASRLKPELFLVFKGAFVTAEAIQSISAMGVTTINYYPDIDITAQGPYIPHALPYYDWIFTTKSFGLGDMKSLFNIEAASFIPHPYDPETHFPVKLDAKDLTRYACEVSFIGAWSPKKEALLTKLYREMPKLNLKIWGDGWGRASELTDVVMGTSVTGREYAKAISASMITVAILTAARGRASSGDLTTTRTFEIPAVGSFMLHERTSECEQFFSEGRECAMFGDGDELVAKIRYYLAHREERERIARGGYRRSLESGYSADATAAVILNKGRELHVQRMTPENNTVSTSVKS